MLCESQRQTAWHVRKGAAKVAWVVLVVAGLFEAGMVLGLNFSEGFTKLWGSLLMVVSGGISFYLLSVAMQTIPAGSAYAVWTAIGASVAVLLGILFLGEPANLLRLAGIAVVLGGVLMLRFAER
jgi:quaternary ammonium compound-resistance protein SugE